MDKSTLDTLKLRDMMTVPELPSPMAVAMKQTMDGLHKKEMAVIEDILRRSTDSRDTIEQITQQRQWKIVKYVHIDELPIAKFYKTGQVMFVKREAVEWKRDSTMPTYEEWRNQMLGGLRPSDWDKFIVR